MNILSSITHTKQAKTGVRVVLAGVEKIGKTTLACGAPRPLLVPLETGYASMNINKTPMLTSLDQVMQLMVEISSAQQFPFQSIIFDSATALERLIHDAVLLSDPAFSRGNKKALTMESALGGYGKAYQFANELFGKFLSACDWLATNRGINIVITCHVFAAKVVDPLVGEYDCWDLLMHSPKNSKTYGKREMITQWADLVGFLHEPIYVVKADNVTTAASANKGRILGANRSPAYVAGNRFNLANEISIPRENGWNYLADAIFKSSGIDVYNKD